MPEGRNAAVPFRAPPAVLLRAAPVWLGRGGHVRPDLTPEQLRAARTVLGDLGMTPQSLARRARPVAFVDVVNEGSTFTELFTLVQDWVLETPKLWRTVRGRLRFLGVTFRASTSPNAFRWQQWAEWTDQLPPSSVVDVSLAPEVWRYLGNDQAELTELAAHPRRAAQPLTR